MTEDIQQTTERFDKARVAGEKVRGLAKTLTKFADEIPSNEDLNSVNMKLKNSLGVIAEQTVYALVGNMTRSHEKFIEAEEVFWRNVNDNVPLKIRHLVNLAREVSRTSGDDQSIEALPNELRELGQRQPKPTEG